MKKQKKILVSIVLFFMIILLSSNVFARDNLVEIKLVDFPEQFKKYMELSEEERMNVIMPRMYNVIKSEITTTNPLKLARLLGSSSDTDYSLKETIPANMVIKDQSSTGSCWAFSSLAMLESTLALKDYKLGNTALVYDFSERHMEYASSSNSFIDGINTKGFNRKAGDGGGSSLYLPYLTNGTGAIKEQDLPFEDNEEPIYLSEIKNKEVVTQVNDIITFPSYKPTDNLTQIKKQIKEHIKNYGAIDAGIHGAQIFSDCYNIKTGAIYCNNSEDYPIDHAVSIVGWDDNYPKENFLESNRPTSNGAWIIKNSWGTEYRMTLDEMKQFVYMILKDQAGWTSVSQVTDDIAKAVMQQLGFTIENNEAFVEFGDGGFMYISYQDANIYTNLTGITNAQNEVTYENIYQYDNFGAVYPLTTQNSKIYFATIFDKKTTGNEYLTQVSINTPEKYTCKVYVNPNGTSKLKSDLQKVKLAAGESETFDAGYHTIEFAEPVKINSNSFVVVVEVQGQRTNEITILTEVNFSDFYGKSLSKLYGLDAYDNVTVAQNKCFITTENGMNANEWDNTSTLGTLSQGNLPNFDTTIKAFTTSKILESIEVTTPPTKTSYLVGENFDKTGMKVKAKYGNGKSEEITDYTISNGTNLSLGQTSVTISYQGKTTTQPIKVEENSVQSIAIITPPTKTEYFAGEKFDKSGMKIEATFKDGTKKEITNYTITNGETLQNGQTSVTISYEGKTATQQITVKPNPVVKLEIVADAIKLNYVVGQNFDPAGMRVKATYESGLAKEVTNYTITNGTNLQVNQTEVTIEFEGQTVTQAITVVEKAITTISVKTLPTKTEYIQNKEELDLTGGVIKISYNDDTTEDMQMTSEQITVSGFDNKELGTKVITLTYQGKTTQFNIVIKEEPKPENSKFDNIQGNVTRIRAYYFTNDNTKDHTIINVEVSNVVKATVNDKMEYYYYLSGNQQENSINDWVKLNSIESQGNNLSFEINTSDISNYEEVANAENIYLYIKEVATRNNMQSEVITSSILLEVGEAKIEEYIDGEKKDEVDPDEIIDPEPGEDPDNTLAPETIPNAGKNIFIVFIIFIVFVIGRFAYWRYKDIKIK